MHELGLMQSAVAAMVREARAHGASRIHRVVIRVGEFSGVEPDALRFAFPVVARGTPAEDAELALDTAPGRELLLARLEMS